MIRVVRISQTKRIVNNEGRTPLKTNGRSIFRKLTGIQNFILIPIYLKKPHFSGEKPGLSEIMACENHHNYINQVNYKLGFSPERTKASDKPCFCE